IRPMGVDRDAIRTSGPTSLDDVLAAYRSDPRVLTAEPDYVATFSDVPNDPFVSQQWALTKIGVTTAWTTTHGSASIYVADLDSGVFDEASTFPAPDGLRGHPDLRGKVAARADFSGSTCSTGATDDCTNHGTITSSPSRARGRPTCARHSRITARGCTWPLRASRSSRPTGLAATPRPTAPHSRLPM